MADSVLVVEDDDEFRSFAVAMLHAAGHDRVYQAATLAGALAEAARVAPDAALVDIDLPDGDGFALARQLTLHAAMRVVLISADCDAGNDEAAQSVGAVMFVAKERLDEVWLRDTFQEK
jgi:CheY-like chemotaxis protein